MLAKGGLCGDNASKERKWRVCDVCKDREVVSCSVEKLRARSGRYLRAHKQANGVSERTELHVQLLYPCGSIDNQLTPV